MAKSFSIRRTDNGELSVLSPEGFLDAHTAPEFEKAIEEEISGGRFRLIVDCEKLSYISSAGLGVFMGYIEEIREQEGDIKICGLTPKVRQTFELLGFDTLFHIVDDIPAATQKFVESPVKEA